MLMIATFTDYAVHNLQKTGNIDPRVNKKHIYIPSTQSDYHGEKDEPSISAPKPVNATTEFVDDMDFAYIPTDGPATVEMVNATKDNFDVDDLVKFQELLLDVEKPLYEGCPDLTKLSPIVKLLNLKGKYGASDKFFTELLGLIKKKQPAGTKWCKKLIKPKKWKVDNKTKKVYENILAKAWRTVDEKFPEIAEDTRNLWLGISADGVDVNMGNMHHSVWPVLTVIYNLPPWLCMKRKFINLSVLISGYPGNDIDVFLEPLVDDLHTLFETGVDTYDASTKDNFNLRAVVLWTINDYPALGTLCGCPYNGFKGCVVCWKDTNCVRLSASSKQSYVGHRRYLPYNHPFRKQKKAFNGQQEFLQAPIPMTGEQIYNEVKHIENKWGKGKQTNNNASENQEDTRGKGYRKLKYWRHNHVPHCIEFMHVEKNVAESIVRTLLHVPGKTKDGLNARLDLAELGVKPELNKPEGCIAEETITEETIEFFSEYHKSMETIGIPPGKHETYENEEGKPLSAGKSSEVSAELFQKAHLYVIQNTDEITPPKNYKDMYDEVDEEFSTVIHHRNDNVLPLVDQRDLANESRDDYYRKDCGAKKASAPVFYGPSTQGLLQAYGYGTIKEYLEWNYFPSTDNESTNMETTDKGNTDKDCIDESNSAMSKGKYVPVCKKHNPNMYSPVPVIGCVLGLASVTTWEKIEKKMGAKKSKTCADKAKGKRKVSCGS
ncbi:putative transposon, En/Spm-like protein [Tanacetum coccineum]